MSSLAKSQHSFLQLLVSTNPLQRKVLLQTLTNDQVRAAVQVIYNVLKGNCALPEKDQKRLKRFRNIIRQFVKKGIRLKERKQLLLKYHFLVATLLKPALDQICPAN